MSKINLNLAQQIIDEYLDGSSTYCLADKYCLQQTSICNLVAGRTWPQCKRPENIDNIIYERKKKGLQAGIRKHKQLPELTDLQRSILAGSLLGDGCLTKIIGNGNSRLIKKQSINRKEYLVWHQEIFGGYSSNVRETCNATKLSVRKDGHIIHTALPSHEQTKNGCVFSTVNHPEFTKYRMSWYNEAGKKIVPLNFELDELSLSIWFFDDGSNNYKQRSATLHTQSFSFSEVDFLINQIKKFNISAKIITRKSFYTNENMPILKISKESYDTLIYIIKKNMIWNCFSHKIQHRFAKKQYEIHSNLSEKDVYFIHECRRNKSKTFIELGEIFNMHPNSIQNIVYGINWKHIYDKFYPPTNK
jgi:hypothetical protein